MSLHKQPFQVSDADLVASECSEVDTEWEEWEEWEEWVDTEWVWEAMVVDLAAVSEAALVEATECLVSQFFKYFFLYFIFLYFFIYFFLYYFIDYAKLLGARAYTDVKIERTLKMTVMTIAIPSNWTILMKKDFRNKKANSTWF